MDKSVKEYFAAFGKWGFLMAALVVGDVIGIAQSYARDWILPQWAWLLILVGILLLSPLFAFHKLRVKRDELQTKLGSIENARPDISIEPRVYNSRAILEVSNSGGGAQFTAVARVTAGNIQPELYTMYWESNKENSCPLDAGGICSILVGGISPMADESRNLFPGGLMLYKMGTSGEQVFGVSSLEDHNRRELNKRYPTMAKATPEDKCSIEVTITSRPSPAKAVTPRRYILKIDHDNGDQLIFASESNSAY